MVDIDVSIKMALGNTGQEEKNAIEATDNSVLGLQTKFDVGSKLIGNLVSHIVYHWVSKYIIGGFFLLLIVMGILKKATDRRRKQSVRSGDKKSQKEIEKFIKNDDPEIFRSVQERGTMLKIRSGTRDEKITAIVEARSCNSRVIISTMLDELMKDDIAPEIKKSIIDSLYIIYCRNEKGH